MYEAPYSPYDFTDKNSFAYETVLKRWPIILTNIIDTIYRRNHDFSLAIAEKDPSGEDMRITQATIDEGKAIIERIGKLKYEMARDRPLEPIQDDGEPQVEIYNTELTKLTEQGKGSWFQVPWLFSECFLYRLLRSYFVQSTHWKSYDPFLLQKQDTFKKSSRAIFQLATTMHELERDKEKLAADPANLNVIFKEMIQICLWGNATDLSMLTHLSHDDIQNLQSVGRDAQAARSEYILTDDQDKVWSHITGLKDGQVDFVLDNAGFELFTDFVFADFLVTYTPYVSKVVFHPKLLPWFVSDVTPPDFKSAISSLLSPAFFPPESEAQTTAHEQSEGAIPTPSERPESRTHLREMVTRWAGYLENGVFALSVPIDTPLGASDIKANFWTLPYPYWNMAELGPEVYNGLKNSGLVIFKGDLNFRKLTGDVRWPAWTPFREALGPLAGSFPILSLRTNKADVVVAVDKEKADKLDKSGEHWRYNGK
ncbi:hypothetical protein POSPLADRAFT_1076550 [Postia placenta MAD-698-R-SB12]|uniref:Sugar phosphate phosphatase n=1 Tax=Postia placenta MAD-698-R-SB12 TaxID=670580 RepID=A0A1X6MKX1_9APHY|nr:hypothetical protein POSPLADRAFT_1076550 [Postia placenta MAD-698-R-SB12]OSX56693.1 hypothetical protein POSPLADRAFT_1076550 [Postia placenta MAD-698-R-SB12]